jgi:transcriptional regulator of acetoin/glycerol metabolism
MEVDQVETRIIWKEFIRGGYYNPEKVRPEILGSWQRCLGKVDPFQKVCSVILAEKEFENLCQDNKELLEVSSPVMDDLYKFVQGSGFVIALSESSGYLLKIIGDQDVIDTVSKINFTPGANWSESVMGTNALGTCISINKPIQVYGSEHWGICVRVGVCSSSPVHDPDSGYIIGALDMTAADCKKVHSHTLGMVVAAVGSIEGQMAAKRNMMRSQHADKFKTLIVESISDGLLTIDNSGVITHINQRATDFLALYGNLLGENIYAVLKKRFGKQENYKDIISVLNSKEKVDNEFVTIFTESGVIRCTITSRCLWEENRVTGKIIAIQEISKIKKIVNRVAGNRAQTFFSDIIGQNKTFLECIEVAVKAAKTSSNVLLIGESGTGKDLFAQAIHNSSSRASEPYVAINCAAIPRDLLGCELFGYTEGAFTGAKRGGNPGKFELADRGTIFLDEIGEMPLDMQISLLRALEEKAITRIGGHGAIPVDVRIISATNKDLSKEVSLGNFRSDLYYRLNVIPIELPPLRERKEDIPFLIVHLTKKISHTMRKEIEQIDPEFIETCLSYSWPGNVRELQNLIEKAISLTNEPVLSIRNLPPHSFAAFDNDLFLEKYLGKRILKKARINAESELIRISLAKSRGNKCLAAKELGIARSSLYRKLKEMDN